jgi:hypothetical protein
MLDWVAVSFNVPVPTEHFAAFWVICSGVASVLFSAVTLWWVERPRVNQVTGRLTHYTGPAGACRRSFNDKAFLIVCALGPIGLLFLIMALSMVLIPEAMRRDRLGK